MDYAKSPLAMRLQLLMDRPVTDSMHGVRPEGSIEAWPSPDVQRRRPSYAGAFAWMAKDGDVMRGMGFAKQRQGQTCLGLSGPEDIGTIAPPSSAGAPDGDVA